MNYFLGFLIIIFTIGLGFCVYASIIWAAILCSIMIVILLVILRNRNILLKIKDYIHIDLK